MSQRENFGSKFAVIMAFAGSAIGLGNIWRFPYTAGEGGGAAFVLVFIVATLVLSLPIFMAESVIGRRSGSNCLGAMRKLAPNKFWMAFGALSVFTPLFIASYYSIVGGWSLEFLFKSLTLSFTGTDPQSVSGIFSSFTAGTWGPIITFTLFLGLTCLIPAFGVTSGIERFSKISIPILFVIIVGVAIYSLSLPGSRGGVEYLLKPDFSRLTLKACANAVGQSFYSLSLGMGIIITYSSYVKKSENIMSSAVGTSVSALLFSVIAGLAIMPAVFSAGINPGSGPGLIFETLPFIFSSMGESLPWLSAAVAILFFLTVLVAALTSSISLIEVGIAYLVEEKKINRKLAALICFGGIWAAGMICVLLPGLFDVFDLISSNLLMPLCALLGVIFVGWIMGKADTYDELTSGGSFKGGAHKAVFFATKYIAPIMIVAILLFNLL